MCFHSLSTKGVGLASLSLISTTLLLQPTMGLATSGIVALTSEELAIQQAQQADQLQTYVDQLIDSEVAADLPPGQLGDAEIEAYEGNLRSFDITTDWYQQQTSDGQQSHRLSIDFAAFYQSADYGDFNLRTDLGQEKKQYFDYKDTDVSGSNFTLQQRHYLLNEDWTMDNTLGINQSFHNNLLSRSDQVNLSSYTFEGFASRIYSDKTEIRLMAGDKVTLSEADGFEKESGRLLGLGVARHLTDGVTAGMQAWKVDDEIQPELGNEISGFVRYESDAGNKVAKAQVITADGNKGFWLEGKYTLNRFDHQAGFYQLDDGLHWMGEDLAGNSKGAFWRVGYRHPKYSLTTGLNWSEGETSENTSVRQGISYHLNRSTQLGGNASFSYSQTLGSEARQSQLSAYIAHHFSNGQNNRLQLTFRNGDTEESDFFNSRSGENNREYEVDYSHRWLLAAANNVGFQLTARQSAAEDNDGQSLQAGLTWQRELEDGNNYGASLSTGRADYDGSASTSSSYRVYGTYRPANSWELRASLEHGRQDNDKSDYQTSANISLSYRASRGKAINARNRSSGTIRGVVFFDENNDGIRQPLEKVAKGITIGLEGTGLPQTSDNNGEFEFTQIQKGKYRIGVAEESIPLPWELAKEAFQSVEVDFRQTKTVDLPLVRLSEID